MLNTRQMQAAEVMVANPMAKQGEIAKLANIDPKTLWKWKKLPEFQEYLHKLCMERYHDLEKVALDRLSDKVYMGDWKAVQYVLDGCGYKAKEEIDINNADINITITEEG